jgi:hypothetical protein
MYHNQNHNLSIWPIEQVRVKGRESEEKEVRKENEHKKKK